MTEMHSNKGQSGWNGLIPGVSRLEEVIDKLGPVEVQGRYSNADWYDFADRTVHVVVLDGQATILKIRVLSDFPGGLVPLDLPRAESELGPIKEVDADHTGTAIFEGPGLRVACGLLGDPRPVRWIEFYAHQEQAVN